MNCDALLGGEPSLVRLECLGCSDEMLVPPVVADSGNVLCDDCAAATLADLAKDEPFPVVDFPPMPIPPGDLEFLRVRKLGLEDAAALLGVPAALLNAKAQP